MELEWVHEIASSSPQDLISAKMRGTESGTLARLNAFHQLMRLHGAMLFALPGLGVSQQEEGLIRGMSAALAEYNKRFTSV
jgi:hypothetical protein